MITFSEDLEIIREIFEDAWSENWGFIPFTSAEFTELGKNLKFLVDLESVRIAEVDGEPAAMIVMFPNINEIIMDLNGRLLPFGWLKLLWRLKVVGAKSARIPLMGVRRRYQGSRMGATLAMMVISPLHERARKQGIKEVDMSWILEQNQGMRNIIETVGCDLYKRYRIYQKDLEQSMTSASPPFSVIILAGDREPNDPVALHAGVSCKALTPVSGRAMVLRVLDALARTHEVGTPILVGPAMSAVEENAELAELASFQSGPMDGPASDSQHQRLQCLAVVARGRAGSADHGGSCLVNP